MRTSNRYLFLIAVTAVAYSFLFPAGGEAQTVQWISQMGTGFHEDADGVSADGLGNVYISGETNGSLGGTSAGGSDAFIAKFDSAGNLAWTNGRVGTGRQIGTSAADHGYAVSADGLGSVYMAGSTAGNLGGTNAGNADAFITKWDAAGVLQWTRQLGTAADDISYGASADKLGNVYISGVTGGSLDGVHTGTHAFISKYDVAGNLLWTQESGFAGSDISYGVSADGLGNVYMAGDSNGGAFVSKYDSAGTLLWNQQTIQRAQFDCRAVSADGVGNVYISGTDLNGDVFTSKYDAAGTQLWTRQLGSNGYDEGLGISADSVGNVYVTGRTSGQLGDTYFGIEDAFVIKYDAAGNLIWKKQLGTSSYEGSLAVSADRLGNVYTAGGTEGSLGAGNRGFGDAFVAKISDTSVPEPTAGILLGMAGLLLSYGRRWTGSH